MRNRLFGISKHIVLLFLLVLSPAALAQPKVATLDAYFEALADARQFSGGVLVVERGKTVFERAYGNASLAPRAAMRTSTRFAYASISKLFTATAILQLGGRGKLDLDVPAARYLPGFPYPGITVRHLLTHSSGLSAFSQIFAPAHAAEPARAFANADLIAALVANPVPLRYPPGSQSNYDNINFTVLALIVERVSGETYSAYVARHILAPAGMRETHFVPLSETLLKPGPVSGTAAPYLFPTRYADQPLLGTAIPYVRSYFSNYRLTGFGDYVGTMRDLARFAAAYDRLIGPAMRAEAFKVSSMADGSPHPNRIGLSWYIGGDAARGSFAFHAGVSVGLACILVRGIDHDRTVIVFSNMQPDVNPIAFDITRLLSGQAVAAPRRSLAVAYVRTLFGEGPVAAEALLDRLARDPRYAFDEEELNAIGYEVMAPGDPFKLGLHPQLAQALEIFRVNLAHHPQSWNAHDSYGEALRKAGRREEAIAMYRQALALHDNASSKKALAELLAEQ